MLTMEDVAHQLRGAVGAGLEQLSAVQLGLAKPQAGALSGEKVDQGNDAAHAVACHRGQGGPGNAQIHQRDKHIVQSHVGHAGGHREE